MRAETFSYLPPMTRGQLEAQIRSAIQRGLVPAVEHTTLPGPGRGYWSMWKLPLFGAKEPGAVLAEVDACARAHPGSLIRVVGYDPAHGGIGTAFVVARPGPTGDLRPGE